MCWRVNRFVCICVIISLSDSLVRLTEEIPAIRAAHQPLIAKAFMHIHTIAYLYYQIVGFKYQYVWLGTTTVNS